VPTEAGPQGRGALDHGRVKPCRCSHQARVGPATLAPDTSTPVLRKAIAASFPAAPGAPRPLSYRHHT
jgi:hypothetical protein